MDRGVCVYMCVLSFSRLLCVSCSSFVRSLENALSASGLVSILSPGGGGSSSVSGLASARGQVVQRVVGGLPSLDLFRYCLRFEAALPSQDLFRSRPPKLTTRGQVVQRVVGGLPSLDLF